MLTRKMDFILFRSMAAKFCEAERGSHKTEKSPSTSVDRLVSGKFNYAINYARVTLPLRMQRVQT